MSRHEPARPRGPRPVAVVVAAVLGVLYAAVLVGVAAVLAYEQVAATGNIGSEHLDGRALGGLVTIVLLFAAGAGALVTGAVRLLSSGARALLAGPLLAVFVFGVIGETVDGLTGATLGSEAIGAGILVLTALPLLLLATPASRAWLSAAQPPTPPRLPDL